MCKSHNYKLIFFLIHWLNQLVATLSFRFNKIICCSKHYVQLNKQ